MTGWIILGVYLFGYVALWRTVAWWFVKEFSPGPAPDGEEVVVAALMAFICTFFWPVILAGRGVRAVYMARGEDVHLFLMPRRERRLAALEERERRIEKMERELGIGDAER